MARNPCLDDINSQESADLYLVKYGQPKWTTHVFGYDEPIHVEASLRGHSVRSRVSVGEKTDFRSMAVGLEDWILSQAPQDFDQKWDECY